jgi:hypothetical protein
MTRWSVWRVATAVVVAFVLTGCSLVYDSDNEPNLYDCDCG